jgi:hypothetical protein
MKPTMDLMDAEYLLNRWNAGEEPATPRIIEAIDIVQFERNAAQATQFVACPSCGAPAQQPCERGVAHRRRIDALMRLREPVTEVAVTEPRDS